MIEEKKIYIAGTEIKQGQAVEKRKDGMVYPFITPINDSLIDQLKKTLNESLKKLEKENKGKSDNRVMWRIEAFIDVLALIEKIESKEFY